MTRSELRQFVKDLIGETGSSSQIPDTMINRLLYESAKYVQSVIEEKNALYFATIEAPINVTATQVDITLPARMSKLVDLRRIDNSEIPFMEVKIQDVYGGTNSIFQDPSLYKKKYSFYLLSDRIRYATPIDEPHIVQMIVTKTIADVANDAEAYPLIPEFANSLIAMRAALLSLNAEDSRLSGMERIFSDDKERVISHVTRRGLTTQRSVRFLAS